MQENVGNITFANDGKVEFENASVGDLHSDTTFTSSSE
jgi:hypothetical protein